MVAFRYSGCLGWSFLVMPRWDILPDSPSFSSIRRTRSPLPRCSPWFPHAHTILSDSRACLSIWRSFSGPEGSGLARSASGLVERRANRLHTHRELYPHPRAKPLHRVTVGSDRTSSAVLGFSIRNMQTPSPPSPSFDSSQYRYRRSGEKDTLCTCPVPFNGDSDSLANYPTAPSRLTRKSCCASMANSNGSSWKIPRQKPLMIM